MIAEGLVPLARLGLAVLDRAQADQMPHPGEVREDALRLGLYLRLEAVPDGKGGTAFRLFAPSAEYLQARTFLLSADGAP